MVLPFFNDAMLAIIEAAVQAEEAAAAEAARVTEGAIGIADDYYWYTNEYGEQVIEHLDGMVNKSVTDVSDGWSDLIDRIKDNADDYLQPSVVWESWLGDYVDQWTPPYVDEAEKESDGVLETILEWIFPPAAMVDDIVDFVKDPGTVIDPVVDVVIDLVLDPLGDIFLAIVNNIAARLENFIARSLNMK